MTCVGAEAGKSEALEIQGLQTAGPVCGPGGQRPASVLRVLEAARELDEGPRSA